MDVDFFKKLFTILIDKIFDILKVIFAQVILWLSNLSSL